MWKLVQKQLDTNLIKISLINALIYCLLFNSAVFAYKFDYYKVTAFRAFLELGKDFIYIYISLFIFFFGLTIHRMVFIIGSLLLFITGAASSYYLFFFKITPSKEIIESVFDSNINEIYELISTKLIVWLIFSLFVWYNTIKHFGIGNTKLFITRLLSAFCLLLTINSIITPPYKLLSSYFPIQYLHNTYLYLTNASKQSSRLDISTKFSFIDNSELDIIGVLVIGESARFDHFGLNGYERNTTPYLSKFENLVSFKAQACANTTQVSVPCLLSRHSTRNLAEATKETSFLSILTKLGFSTNWIGTQTLLKNLKNVNPSTFYDDVRFVITPGGSALFKMNAHDGIMLPYIENFLTSNEKQFLVVHSSGSHWDYFFRYPEQFQQFNPICKRSNTKLSFTKADPSSCDLYALVNDYDNSILYTDFFLSRIINLLKEKNAFLIYASDHGESLGENGRYCHGGEASKEQMTIPFIVWFSDKYKANHPEFAAAIKTHQGQEISHDNIFHSVLDCIGISSEIIDKNLSLCRPHG